MKYYNLKSIFSYSSVFAATLFCLNSSAQSIPVSNDQYHLYGPNSTWNQYLQIGGNGQVTSNASIFTTNGNLHLESKAGFDIYLNHYNRGNTLINSAGGRVAINHTVPLEALDVNGNIRSTRIRTGNAVFNSNSRSSFNSFNPGSGNLATGWISADFGAEDNNTDRLVLGTGYGGRCVIGTHASGLDDWGGALLINPAGQGGVAIGTTELLNAKLAVNGLIRAKEIKVETSNWPDYVFARQYKPRSLSEVENYILENKHLPEIPSAAEVEKEGINLGEMNSKLLQKIEELTLYLIEHNRIIKDQAAKIEDLGEDNEKLKLEIITMKKKLN